MRAPPARDGAIAVFLVVLLVVVAGASAPGKQDLGHHPGSSHLPSGVGTKALYLLLGRLGHRVERSNAPLGDFGTARMAFVLGPEIRLADADLPGLRSWVARGGTLIYGEGEGEPDAHRLQDLFGVRVRRGGPSTAAAVGPDFAPARTVWIDARATVEARKAGDGLIRVTREEGAPAIAILQVGEGRIVVLGSAGIAANDALAEADNAVFFAVLARRYAGHGRIVFDEWTHGFGQATAALALATLPAALCAVLGGLALLAYGFAAGRRIGRPSAEPVAPRRASIEQVAVLARFFDSRRARRAALEALGIAAPAAVRSDAELVRLARAGLSGDGPVNYLPSPSPPGRA